MKVAAADNEAPGTGTEGWIYYPTTGEITANLVDEETDSKNVSYNAY